MKAWKVFLGIGISVLLIGIIVFIIGFSLNGCNMHVEYEMKTYSSTQENTVLDLNMSAGEMNVEFYDGNTIEIEYPDASNFGYGYTVSENNGKLSVKPRTSAFLWFGWNNIPAVNVKIPNGNVMDLKLSASAGVAKIADGQFKNVRLSLSAGSVSVGEITCEIFDAGLSAGKLDVKSVNCTEFDVDLSAGTAGIDKLQCDNIEIELSAGSARLNVCGRKEDYTVKVDKSAGSCNLSSQHGAVAGKIIDIDISAGSVNVSFTD